MESLGAPVAWGRDCAQGRAWLTDLADTFADSDRQMRVWVERRRTVDERFDTPELAINDLYDRFLEGGVDGLLGCEIRTRRELDLLSALHAALEVALAVHSVGETRELIESPAWSAVQKTAGDLLAELSSPAASGT